MKIHEYQGKEIFRKYGVMVPEGKAALSVEEAYQIAQELGGPVVVKAQIHAGGRGKGGGVKLAKNAEEAKSHANAIFGMMLKTHQTGPEGQKVRKLLVERASRIKKEYYLGMVLDRATSRVTFMFSTEGGMDIEEVAATHLEKILKEVVDPAVGFVAYQGRKLTYGLGIEASIANQIVKMMDKLYQVFLATDASLVEINPLIETEDGQVLALDAKINFDDNALYRHPDIETYRDLDEENPQETEAKKYDLSFISLHGNIGCMVNGAGLAMATMDIIKLHGGEPANFLDVGGGATADRVTAAFKIILQDPKVKAILVNIFGGIMKCDVIATGVVAAAKELGLKVPLVVRLLGTNVDLGKKILAESGLPIISADTMSEAAEKVVKAIA
ncbi:MAG: ADP-forming succinate--CoA ligase subunit beta [Deltaproteobacteria bacterium]|nr:ADP-forming succinate--CoA ligase subunit beta [Deltaproteobacteria bacterium]